MTHPEVASSFSPTILSLAWWSYHVPVLQARSLRPALALHRSLCPNLSYPLFGEIQAPKPSCPSPAQTTVGPHGGVPYMQLALLKPTPHTDVLGAFSIVTSCLAWPSVTLQGLQGFEQTWHLPCRLLGLAYHFYIPGHLASPSASFMTGTMPSRHPPSPLWDPDVRVHT